MVRKVEDNSQRKALVKEAFSIRLKKSYRVASSGGNYYFLLLFKNSKSDNFIQFLLERSKTSPLDTTTETVDLRSSKNDGYSQFILQSSTKECVHGLDGHTGQDQRYNWHRYSHPPLAPEYDPVEEVGEEVYDLEVLKQLESMPKTPAPMTQLLLHNSSWWKEE